MARAQARTVLQIDVVGVEIFCEQARNVAVGPVIVQLARETRLSGDRARPLRRHVAAADRDVGAGTRLADAAIVEITLQGGAARARRLPVHAEPTLPQVPVVGGVLPVGPHRRIAVEPPAVDARANPGAQRRSVADCPEAVLLGAAATRQQQPLRVPGVLRDDVDTAVAGVGPPQRGPGTADDLDPVNVLKWDLL